MPCHLRTLLLSALMLFTANCFAATAYPSDLAREVPLFPQAQLDSASQDAQGANAVLNTTSPLEQAIRFYSEKLTGKGWKQTADIAMGAARALEFKRGKSSISISIVPTSAGTTIALTLNR
ncbi:MAG: hypothetical protein CVV05_08655 [Gammaproteobacteria bacterium HGW-Gammaproteobacteria-1]|jgi:hypothetical protein|nr:MAG: hypothetical protein CVV05_08655 [Gammaproteobacteria bacterium HGW-Gammaproteobacteria-1]